MIPTFPRFFWEATREKKSRSRAGSQTLHTLKQTRHDNISWAMPPNAVGGTGKTGLDDCPREAQLAAGATAATVARPIWKLWVECSASIHQPRATVPVISGAQNIRERMMAAQGKGMLVSSIFQLGSESAKSTCCSNPALRCAFHWNFGKK